MSKLAQQLAECAPASERVRKGPAGVCHGKYPADIEDWNAIEQRRTNGETWREVQTQIDGILGIPAGTVSGDKFRYHWRRKCWCWPDELRNA